MRGKKKKELYVKRSDNEEGVVNNFVKRDGTRKKGIQLKLVIR